MTFEEIRDWALAHGFEEQPDERLSVPYRDHRIEIEFKHRVVRVTATDGTREDLIVSVYPSRAHVNEHGVLEGLGLSASFLVRASRGPDSVPPPWMGQAYLDAVGWQRRPAEAAGPVPV